MLKSITPIILTYNELPNIRRTLKRLEWARRIVIVDSYSDDGTVEYLRSLAQASVFQRRFDSHANQWNYAFRETGIDTPWVLALDADYQLTNELVDEIASLDPEKENLSGYTFAFIYCVFGKQLRGTLYPASNYLFKLEHVRCVQDGHTQRLIIDGLTKQLSEKILHDDRKPLSRWIRSQDSYMQIEKDIIRNTAWRSLSWPDRVRKLRLVSPFLIFFYVLFVKGIILDGRAGIFYAMQRLLAETLLMIYIIQDDLLHGKPEDS